jgi:hypothetical protein
MLNQKIKLIADAHIASRKSGKFSNVPIKNKREMINVLYSGYTIERILDQIEQTSCGPISLFLMRRFKIATIYYKLGVYEGFKKLLLKK